MLLSRFKNEDIKDIDPGKKSAKTLKDTKFLSTNIKMIIDSSVKYKI